MPRLPARRAGSARSQETKVVVALHELLTSSALEHGTIVQGLALEKVLIAFGYEEFAVHELTRTGGEE